MKFLQKKSACAVAVCPAAAMAPAAQGRLECPGVAIRDWPPTNGER